MAHSDRQGSSGMVCPFVVARIRAEVEDKVPAPQSRLLWHSAPLSNTRAHHQHMHVLVHENPLTPWTTCDWHVLKTDLIR